MFFVVYSLNIQNKMGLIIKYNIYIIAKDQVEAKIVNFYVPSKSSFFKRGETVIK